MSHADSINRVHERLRARQDDPTFTYYGGIHPCTANTYARRTRLEVGGEELEADLVLWVKKDLFLTMASTVVTMASESITMADNRPYPASGRKLTFAGRQFRIGAVHDAMPLATDTPLQLVCVSITK